jgi:hypothetical protein
MAFSSIISSSDLDEGFILAPERYDPRRSGHVANGRRLDEIAEIVSQHVQPGDFENALVLDTTHAVEGFVRLTGANGINPSTKSAKKRLQPGDVIISRLRPYLRQTAFASPSLWAKHRVKDVVCSTEFYVLRSRDDQSLAFIVPFLLSSRPQEILGAAQEGGHHPRFNANTLGGIMIPDDRLKARQRTSETVTKLADEALTIEQSLKSLCYESPKDIS